MPALKTKLDNYLLNVVIQRDESVQICSPLVLVKKPDGNIRVAVDYRNLNQVLVPYVGSIPDMKSLFNFEVVNFEYVLVTYPVRPPSKLSPIYRGPLIIVEKVHNNIFKCQDIISNKVLELNVDNR